MIPIFESIVQDFQYGELDERWMVPDIHDFSPDKSLYDYQVIALQNAARALYLYFHNKDNIREKYNEYGLGTVSKYERTKDKIFDKINPVYSILSEYFQSTNDEIDRTEFINRMCFWMATGSGKTLILVKMIEYLWWLIKHGEIKPYNILILAPSDHLIDQIVETVNEFNQTGLYIDLVPLREIDGSQQGRLSENITVYYHRSDNISHVQKEALTDFRVYENGGKWYVLLDEAHKGDKEDSKRQAYYSIMARNGFLFNFSATFTEEFDIATTVINFNLEEFVHKGYGKNILLNKAEYHSFKHSRQDTNDSERQMIVLKSLITLSYITIRINNLRKETKETGLYHQPLMLTLVNAVNTSIHNDMWVFFQTLKQFAVGEIDRNLFLESKKQLLDEWQGISFLFPDQELILDQNDITSLHELTEIDLREVIFHTRVKGAIQVIQSVSNKELALQLKNTESPFALIRIGDTSKWRNQLLGDYEQTTTLQETSYFDSLEGSPITILMGSRSFFESWDSNRPNVINFINIGGSDAKKYVMQSVGRGVRLELLSNMRKRLSHVPITQNLPFNRTAIGPKVWPVETLFLFATNRSAFDRVFKVLDSQQNGFKLLDGIQRNVVPIDRINQLPMPLLVPEYHDCIADESITPFALSLESYEKYKSYLNSSSDSVLLVRDGCTNSQITALREVVDQPNKVTFMVNKNYKQIEFLHRRLLSHLERTEKNIRGVRKLDEDENDGDIVHFRHIRVHEDDYQTIYDKIKRVAQGKASNEEIETAATKLGQGGISRLEFDHIVTGSNEEEYRGDLKIKHLVEHYYCPTVLASESSDYIQHVIKISSELAFLKNLDCWLNSNSPNNWDAWMFSKIDESLDKVFIPYYDTDRNMDRKFYPDFVFWMSKSDLYQIVFVDPKSIHFGTTNYKIEGYKKLFESEHSVRLFHYDQYLVSVKLLCFNKHIPQDTEYRNYWTSEIGAIFEPTPT